MRDRDDDPEVPEWLVRAAVALGASPIRARWKLLGWARALRDLERRLEPTSRRFSNQVCGACGAVVNAEEKACPSCGARLHSGIGMFFRRLGLSVPSAIGVSSALGALLLVAYFRVLILAGPRSYFSLDLWTALSLGANHPGVLHEPHEWWRWVTSIFLHFGLWHLGTNVFSLSQIGPAVEEYFGRGVTIFAFAVTGVLGFVGSSVAAELWRGPFVGAGASGAISGLIGMAAIWGHRQRSSAGRALRDHMVQWMVYTTAFGFLVNADHVAHFTGFAVGALIGRVTPLEAYRRQGVRGALGVIGVAICALGALLVLRGHVPTAVEIEALDLSSAGPASAEP